MIWLGIFYYKYGNKFREINKKKLKQLLLNDFKYTDI